MPSYTLLEAARLAEASYDATTNPLTRNIIKGVCGNHSAQAYMLNNGTLLITGSNGFDDYLKFNLQVFSLFGTQYSVRDGPTEAGASRSLWHQGFLAHARLVFKFAKPFNPKFVIGHSLGGASAQILAKSFGVPAIGFGSPRTRKKGSGRIKGEKHSLTILHKDDLVAKMPGSFRHLGRNIRVAWANPRSGPKHAMKYYIELLTAAQGNPGLPARWPE